MTASPSWIPQGRRGRRWPRNTWKAEYWIWERIFKRKGYNGSRQRLHYIRVI